MSDAKKLDAALRRPEARIQALEPWTAGVNQGLYVTVAFPVQKSERYLLYATEMGYGVSVVFPVLLAAHGAMCAALNRESQLAVTVKGRKRA